MSPLLNTAFGWALRGAGFACNDITVDKDGNLWLLTDRHVYRFDRVEEAFVLFPTPNGDTDAGFRAFAQDPARSILSFYEREVRCVYEALITAFSV